MTPFESGDRPGDTDPRIEIRNEFAAVALEVDRRGNDPRLRITDIETGESIFLDAALLRSLVTIPQALVDEINRAAIRQEPGHSVPASDIVVPLVRTARRSS